MSDSPTRFRTASDYVYFHVRRWIIEGQLKSGERIEQEVIASRLDASRMPVRTALERLAAEGLVVITAHRGATVTPMTTAEVTDVYAIRIRLEPWAIQLATGNVTDSSFAEAERLVTAGAAALDRREWGAYLESNLGFYTLIWEATGNAILRQFLGQLFARALRYRWIYVKMDGRRALQTSVEVLDSLRAGKPAQGAERLAYSLAQARDELIHLNETAQSTEASA